MRFQIEVAPGVAEDEGKIVGIGPTEVPFGRFEETIRLTLRYSSVGYSGEAESDDSIYCCP